jgi:DNA primase
MNRTHRYADFSEEIDLDALYSTIGFEVLDTDGLNDVGHCMFPENHSNGDTTGKFAIHREKKVYNCWVCGGGSLLSLVMEIQNCGTEAATDFLLQFAQHDMRSDAEFTDYLLDLLDDVEHRVERMPYFNDRVLKQFNGSVEYFLSRGISRDVIDQYHLCYGEVVMKPAPMKMRDGVKTKIDVDYYGPAAIFPHYWQGKLVGWQHRWMDWNAEKSHTPKWLAKYTNTTEFPASNTLFNYDNAFNMIAEFAEPVVVCESVPTVLFLSSLGYPAVAYFGEVPKDAQLRLMRRFTAGVILAPDNDPTGSKLLTASTPYLERFIPVYHAARVDMGPKADLGDYAQCKYPEREVSLHLTERIKRVEIEL